MNTTHAISPTLSVLPACLLLLLSCGCGSDGNLKLPTVAVSGIVRLDGKPLPQAIVQFLPEQDGIGSGAAGRTDADGRYELTIAAGSNPKPGAVAGNYRVVVSAMGGKDGVPYAPNAASPSPPQGLRELLPRRFSDPQFSVLRVTVAPQGGVYDLETKSR